MQSLEKMADFFAARIDMYDEHMLSEVEGCREGYIKMAEFVPDSCRRLLDLGCGTGLELDAIFKRLPDVSVIGIDICRDMLSLLEQKYKGRSIEVICSDYFSVDFSGDFDCAVSFQTMHHFSKDKKIDLYRKIFNALKADGVYIECDYMVTSQDEEDHWFGENRRIRKSMGISEDEFYHYDTPCTVDNQIKMLKTAGFYTVEKVMRIENTTMLVARK